MQTLCIKMSFEARIQAFVCEPFALCHVLSLCFCFSSEHAYEDHGFEQYRSCSVYHRT